MEKAKVLALLLCEHAAKDLDGKVTLHGLFDRIVIPRNPRFPKLFYVFYRIDVMVPCTVKLAVLDPTSVELGGKWRDMWRDSFSDLGPIQSVWPLSTTVFDQAGPYRLELRQELNGFEAVPLASTLLIVDRDEKR